MGLRTRAALGILGLLVGAAHGQIATPPPEKTTPMEGETPKPQPGIPPEDMTKPLRTKQGAVMPQLPTDVNYDVLLQRDDAGAVVDFDVPTSLLALKANPKLPDGKIEELQQYFSDRNEIIRHLLVSNIDIVERIDDGLIESLDANKRPDIARSLEVLKPLMHPSAPKVIIEDLRDKKLLGQMEWNVSNKIAMNYVMTKSKEQAARDGLTSDGDIAFRTLMSMYRQNFEEYLLLFAAANSAISAEPGVAQAAGLDANAASQVARLAPNLASADANARRTAMTELRSALTVDQRKALYKAALEKVPFTFH